MKKRTAPKIIKQAKRKPTRRAENRRFVNEGVDRYLEALRKLAYT